MEFGEQILLTDEERQAFAPRTDLAMIIPAPATVEQFSSAFELYELPDLRDLAESLLATKVEQLQDLKVARSRHHHTEAVFQLRRDINTLELALRSMFDYVRQEQAETPPADHS
jgi:hypothetical protein